MNDEKRQYDYDSQDTETRPSGCLICGKPLIYSDHSRIRKCFICRKEFIANCECEAGHYVCDTCHEAELTSFFMPGLLASDEKDPQKLLDMVMELPSVHLHGPEHHVIVPCVLLTAYKNNGGEISLERSLTEAMKRAKQVPGGVCGYWGACGASIGAGIYLSVITGSNPLHKEAWPFPQRLVAQCLEKNAGTGGVRCCKRTSRIAIETAVVFTSEWFGIDMPLTKPSCTYMSMNKECLFIQCPFFPSKR